MILLACVAITERMRAWPLEHPFDGTGCHGHGTVCCVRFSAVTSPCHGWHGWHGLFCPTEHETTVSRMSEAGRVSTFEGKRGRWVASE